MDMGTQVVPVIVGYQKETFKVKAVIVIMSTSPI